MAAKNIKGLYSNNRRRETNAVTCSVPYVLGAADLREGTPQEVVITADAYTCLTIPANCIVTAVNLVIEAGAEYGTGSTVGVKLGAIDVITAGATDAAGLIAGTNVPALVDGSSEDLIITPALAGTSTEDSVIKVVVEYTDYDLATVSYIGID